MDNKGITCFWLAIECVLVLHLNGFLPYKEWIKQARKPISLLISLIPKLSLDYALTLITSCKNCCLHM